MFRDLKLEHVVSKSGKSQTLATLNTGRFNFSNTVLLANATRANYSQILNK